jgi:hypothetical protein
MSIWYNILQHMTIRQRTEGYNHVYGVIKAADRLSTNALEECIFSEDTETLEEGAKKLKDPVIISAFRDEIKARRRIIRYVHQALQGHKS